MTPGAERRDRTVALSLLSLTGLSFVLFNVFFLPRLSNNHFGDIEFTGWSGPFGERLLHGDRPYVDFVLPIPPGSFAVLAAIQWLVGRGLVLEELWLNAILQLGLGAITYAMLTPLTSRKNATFAAVATLITLTQLNKECAYDHTAQILSWATFPIAVRALLSDDEHRRARLWSAVGFFAAFTLAFKQSTAVGAILGWLTALSYLFLVEWLSGNRSRARKLLPEALSYARGLGYGVAALWFLLIALGSSASAYFQAVFRDASILKGGSLLMARNVAGYLFTYPAYAGSLGIILGIVLVGFRLVRVHGHLHSGDEVGRDSPFRWWDVAAVAVSALGAFVGGAALLGFGPPGYPPDYVLQIDRLKQVAAFGLVFGAALVVAHAVRTPRRDAVPIATDAVRVGHVMNALIGAALVATILHNTSAPEFRPFYDNDPIIPLAFLALFSLLDRARLGGARILALGLVAGSLFGNKFYRAMTATVNADAGTYWTHMRVNDRGVAMIEAANRARQLTRPDETVLVLPEDVQLAALVGRPRPPLLGAIVFVDQYAPRLAEDDIRRLEESPPKVIVLHPRSERSWQRFFRIWSGDSGAERVIQFVLHDLIPERYRRDRRYDTTFLWEPGTLEIYVKRDFKTVVGEGGKRVEVQTETEAETPGPETEVETPEPETEVAIPRVEAPSDADPDVDPAEVPQPDAGGEGRDE
jgi:hypothetical protein